MCQLERPHADVTCRARIGQTFAIACSLLIAACASLPPARTLTETERATPATLNVGDPAPSIALGEWVRGGSAGGFGADGVQTGSDAHLMAGFAPGKVYVLEFWASWCGPCLASMPRTSRLQAKHGGMTDDAPLVIIGISAVSEGNDRGDIRRAVREMDPQFRIAIDAVGGTGRAGEHHGAAGAGITTERYAVAARETAFPRAFIVDQRGHVAWIGHPADMKPIVEAVLAGTGEGGWNIEEAAADARRRNHARTESRAIAKEFFAALDAKDAEAQLRAAERVTRFPVADVDGLSPAYWGWTTRVHLLADRAMREPSATDATTITPSTSPAATNSGSTSADGATKQAVNNQALNNQPLTKQALIEEAKAAAAEAAEVAGVRDDPMALGTLSEALRPIDLDAATLYADRAMALVESLEAKPPTDEWEAFLAHGDVRRHAYVRIQSALTYAAATPATNPTTGSSSPPARQPDYAKAAKLLKQAIAVWPEDRRMLPNKVQLRERLEGIEEKAKAQAL